MIFLLHHVFLLGKVRNVWYSSQVSVITVTYPASSSLALSLSTVTPLSTSTSTSTATTVTHSSTSTSTSTATTVTHSSTSTSTSTATTVTPSSTSTSTTSSTIIASPTPLPITCSTGDIRIISGNIVQWCVNTVWKPICFDDEWDYREAIVSCKEVGLESAGKFIYLT